MKIMEVLFTFTFEFVVEEEDPETDSELGGVELIIGWDGQVNSVSDLGTVPAEGKSGA